MQGAYTNALSQHDLPPWGRGGGIFVGRTLAKGAPYLVGLSSFNAL